MGWCNTHWQDSFRLHRVTLTSVLIHFIIYAIVIGSNWALASSQPYQKPCITLFISLVSLTHVIYHYRSSHIELSPREERS